MANYVVIGATGDVGRGIVSQMLTSGHCVVAMARNQARLDALNDELGHPNTVSLAHADLSTDEAAEASAALALELMPQIDGVVVSVNGPRQLPGLITLSSVEFTRLVEFDLVAHFAAARAFLPVIAPGGVLLGIGGGSADFILAGGAHMSIAQAGLRMLYRGLAQELGEGSVRARLLTVASVVNGRSTAAYAKPEWVTADEIGGKVIDLLRSPGDHPVYRISRRNDTGQPGFEADTPTRVQGLTT
jgi:NAD(P)-dependent dehydrogenase (short-subunit alcohol dehydrogenase family)